jgi:hypothetical protein
MNVLDDLLGDLMVVPPTLAKAANSANRGHPCGAQPYSGPAKPVRILANLTSPPDPDSQEIATLRNSATTPQSEETRGGSQNSQKSQGVPTPAPVSTCKGCAHLLPYGTCGSPVEAGLADSFVIVWAPENHAGTCTPRTTTGAAESAPRPYRLTVADADAAHAVAWDRAAIDQFLTREARLMRLGFAADDASDLAEAAHLREVTGDDRIACWQCTHLRHWRCLNRQALLSTSEIGRDLAALPQHCPGFAPLARPPPPPAAAHHHQTDHDRTQTEPRPIPHYPPEPTFKDDITVIISDSGGTAFTPCPAGSYLSRCTRLIDLGTQTTDYQGEVKTSRKLLLSWEILDSETRRDDGAPFLLSKRFTTSLHEKSALRKDLASWRGRDFTPPELKGFDLATVLGKDAFISVVQATKPDGRTYSNIGALMRPPKGLAGAPAAEPLLHWDMGSPAPDWRAFELLSPKLQEQIQASPEFARLRRPTTVVLSAPAAPARPAAATEPPPHAFADLADDIDF